ncbi:MbcA/ParS/Xre antitoxin family protein [Vibrio pomeroyi]|uniref:MbcA/ParS/Xre antitoxin family protein n=1 Tax=Vibrio pomeroyi TaxID=198832 RepID=A0ABV4MR97_9VIBR|nr:MbcA/ParS/Xre antitoxin family protein [Vibrio atlanticus]MCZ4310260.1 MbcA/ParS/Xre antitoxin family protein [Vibrio atlanticus]
MNLAKQTGYDPKALSMAGFKAADNILSSWGCTAQQSQNILKISSTSYHKFKANPEKTNLSDDQLERVSYLLNMHQALRIVFSNPANVNGFMSMKNNNDYFAGRTPLEIISSGKFGDLYEVGKRIDALRGGLWG